MRSDGERRRARDRRFVDRGYGRRRALDPELAAAQRIRNSKAWRDCARAYRAAHPLCEPHLAQGKRHLGVDVDHVVPLHVDDERAFDWTNLQTVCRAYHATKTAAETAARRRPRGPLP